MKNLQRKLSEKQTQKIVKKLGLTYENIDELEWIIKLGDKVVYSTKCSYEDIPPGHLIDLLDQFFEMGRKA